MKKGDLFSGSGLEWYAEVGLIIFVVAFVAIIVRVFVMNKKEADNINQIPLDDDILPEERAQSPQNEESKEGSHE